MKIKRQLAYHFKRQCLDNITEQIKWPIAEYLTFGIIHKTFWFSWKHRNSSLNRFRFYLLKRISNEN
jgi:hypothetical protein